MIVGEGRVGARRQQHTSRISLSNRLLSCYKVKEEKTSSDKDSKFWAKRTGKVEVKVTSTHKLQLQNGNNKTNYSKIQCRFIPKHIQTHRKDLAKNRL
ncbi:hypothetical protein TNCT_616581 [Trichonephila clavata]|uniref:Uncharacterized protein n=1 Tax=Trichonephila clavata TaxID=2740835 RepID=A0A8X6HDU0_TRICU|nr:hypothetical protein TNCT_616581 [Trichonephila clavata]